MFNFCGTSRLFPAPYDYMETQTLAAGDSRRQSASLLLLKPGFHIIVRVTATVCDCLRLSASIAGTLTIIWKPGFRINHMLITAQSNGVNFPTNLRYNIHHSDLQILRQTELLLQIVPDSLRFLTAIWKQVNLETAGDRRR